MSNVVVKTGSSAVPTPRPRIAAITTCRACGSRDLDTVFDLGWQYIVDFVDDGARMNPPRGKAPLELLVCQNCRLVQLAHTVNPDLLFREFWYRSSANKMMRHALVDIVANAQDSVGAKEGDDIAVLDIGCNDGYLLSRYPKSFIRVGYDPAEAVLNSAVPDCADILVADYFSGGGALAHSNGRKYKIVTAIAMFYDLDNPLVFLQGVADILDEAGVLIIQMNYLPTMLDDLAFDNISHEHLCYYTLGSLINLATAAGLYVVHVDLNDVNGGSFRVYMRHIYASRQDSSVSSRLRLEASRPLPTRDFGLFRRRVDIVCSILNDQIRRLARGSRVFVYGASTRGTTILQTLLRTNPELPNLLSGAVDIAEFKNERYMVGTWTRIAKAWDIQPRDVLLLLPYHFVDNVLEQEREWMVSGGRILVPLPEPRLLGRRSDGTLTIEVCS